MLLPLMDFLNHSGDETECFPGDRAVPTANVRYRTAYVLLYETTAMPCMQQEIGSRSASKTRQHTAKTWQALGMQPYDRCVQHTRGLLEMVLLFDYPQQRHDSYGCGCVVKGGTL